MRLCLDWLAEWVDLPDAAELVHQLDMCGFEDALVEQTGPDLSAFRVGCVLEREPHPDADRLSVCRVDLGAGEPVEIVCGAPNVAAGQKVVVASPGTRLPDGTKLKKSKIRGVTSLGMICSVSEMGLGDEHDGILVLDPEAPLGAPVSDVIAAGPRVLEVGITPNRGDTASLLGVAREVRAIFESPIRAPETEPPEAGAPASTAAGVSIEAQDACHHYVARIVRGVQVGPSPEWLVARLEASGIRSINNVVDVTNLVLLELGQPLHGFDLAKLAGAEIRVRRARAGEKLDTLDGETRELCSEDLVIADAERAIALAGVMGGADTEVTDATRDVLIESAHFDPKTVRLGARRAGLNSEASYRFERGVDREGIARAADRCARLLAELAGGTVAPDRIDVRGSEVAHTDHVRLDCARANSLLGLELGSDEMRALLERVGIACESPEDGVLVGAIPSHRNDLHIPEDLTEELARIHGYDRIPTTLPSAVLAPAPLPPGLVLTERVKDAFVAAGLTETVSFPFVSAAEMEALLLPEGDERRETLSLVNPIKEEEPQLRTHLLPSLLRAARLNRARQAEGVQLFEVSRVFLPQGPGELPHEPLQAVALLLEDQTARLWGNSPAPLFFQAKGIAERLLNLLGYDALLRRGTQPAYLHPGASGTFWVGEKMVGAVGELHPETCSRFEIDVPGVALELDLSALLAQPAQPPQYREVSRFPQVRRDLAVLVDREHAADDLVVAVRKGAGKDCTSVEIFDRYEGKGVPEGKVSLAFRLVFQRADRTLEDSEVTPAVDRVVRTLLHRFGAELR
ncbi:MAG: phenylalanine--tRNA ligase subunit beta [Deltaproteobacteria bacterium]|nr:phenylalanine--tRNA ligase subunit beta [Deltaproteobacteria bacterium]MBW2360438.1 phenylalanine--tRNA ligase subunit beta [Deltaproteobacteria bacterium]